MNRRDDNRFEAPFLEQGAAAECPAVMNALAVGMICCALDEDLTFIWGNMTEFIHLYTADGWQGEMVQGDACKEGVLEWVPKEKVTELPIWEGDKIFFRLLNGDRPYFSLKLVYDGDTLKQAVLDGEQIVGKT